MGIKIYYFDLAMSNLSFLYRTDYMKYQYIEDLVYEYIIYTNNIKVALLLKQMNIE